MIGPAKIAAAVRAALSVVAWCLGFFEEGTRQSSARLVGILCGVAGAAVAVICALQKNEQAATVAALIAGGAVALLTRKPGEPGNPGGGAA